MRERVDLGVLCVPVDTAETGECVLSVDVHSARATDALSARPPERQRRINLILNLDQCVQHLHHPPPHQSH